MRHIGTLAQAKLYLDMLKRKASEYRKNSGIANSPGLVVQQFFVLQKAQEGVRGGLLMLSGPVRELSTN